jgi:hypothetical protein
VADKGLIEQLANGVFDPPVAFVDLADYHLDFEQLAAGSPEADVRERAERQTGCCVVVGPSGAGKSSVIAAVAASLGPQRFAVRIQGVNDPSVLTREGFALHVGRETLRVLQAVELDGLSKRDLSAPRKNLASSAGRTSGGHGVLLTLPVGFAAELKTSAREVVETSNPTSIAQAIDQLVAVTDRHGRRLLLLVEDTDVFMPPDPLNASEGERPRRFIDGVVTYLARDFPASSLVAVNDRYRELIPRGSVTVVDLPTLEVHAIGRLIEHYARQHGLHITADQVAEPEALTYAAGRYKETRDIRRTLELLHKGARKIVGESRGGLITADVLHGL